MYISHQHQNQYPIFSRFVFVSSLFPLYILYISHQNTTLYTCHVLKMDCIPILRDSHQPLKIYIYISTNYKDSHGLDDNNHYPM